MKTVRKLSAMEIDEVSLVDRPANQHGLVTITKRAEDDVTYYDAAGNEVAEADLRDGDVVYTSNDDNAEEIVMLSAETSAALEERGMSVDEFLDSVYGQADAEQPSALAGVGKRFGKADAATTGGPSTAFQAGRRLKTKKLGLHDGGLKKSLGAEVLEELSKALDDGDRDQIISKVAERVSKAEQAAAKAIAKAQALEEQAELEAFCKVAADYQLPIQDEELGEILQAVSKVLSEDQLDTLDRVLTAAGAGAQTTELGSPGYAPSFVMDSVAAAGSELVGKAAGGLTAEQATTELFAANPEAYDEYLYESRS